MLTDIEAGEDGEADAVSEAWLVWSNAQQKHPVIAKRVLALQDLIHSTRNQYINETGGAVACFISTASGIEAFAKSTTADSGETVDQLLTPLEALRVFQAEPETPTAELRADHFERQQSLVLGPLTTETVAAGNLKGVRKWAWQRLGGNTLYTAASDAINAFHDRPLTQYATQRLSQARRNRYSLDDLAALLAQLHDEDRLVIGTTDTDEIRIMCSLGVRDE